MAASTAVSIRVDVSIEESEVNMNLKKTDYTKNKSIVLKGEDMRIIDSLIFSPLFLDRMPEKVKGKRNKMVLWSIKELDKILRDGIKEQQMYLNL